MAAALATAAAPASAKVQSAWVQMGPGGKPIARLVIGGGSCPSIALDGRKLATAPRAFPLSGQPTVVCERTLPVARGKATVGGRTYDLGAAASPDRILVTGDTGCVVEKGFAQDCNDPQAWPFANVAASSAKTKPDLVIHVGDLLYREDPCPTGDTGCAGDPTGQSYATLRADFFTPAKPLLAAAPWVVVRGNHENCNLDGPGWYRYFGLGSLKCRVFSAPYDLPLGGGLGLVVVDDAEANYDNTDPAQVPIYAAQFRKADALARKYRFAWMTIHQPPFGIDGAPGGSFYNAGNATMLPAALAAGGLSDRFLTIVSGHQHLLQVLDFGGRRASQLTIGTGGGSLDTLYTTEVTGTDVGGIPVAAGLVEHDWGYSVLDRRSATSWRMTQYDPRGRTLARCTLSGRRAACAPA